MGQCLRRRVHDSVKSIDGIRRQHKNTISTSPALASSPLLTQQSPPDQTDGQKQVQVYTTATDPPRPTAKQAEDPEGATASYDPLLAKAAGVRLRAAVRDIPEHETVTRLITVKLPRSNPCIYVYIYRPSKR